MNKFFLIAILWLMGCHSKKEITVNKINKAFAYFDGNENSKALKEISTVLEIDSLSIDAYILKGEIENSMGTYRTASCDLIKAYVLDSSSKTARFNLGISYYFLDKNDSAIDLFSSIINQKGHDQFYFDSEKKEDGKNISRADIPMVNLKYFRGLAYYHNNMSKNAMEDLEFCLDKKYNPSIVNLYVGLIYIEYGMKEKGCKYLNEAKVQGNMDAASLINKWCK